MRRMTIASALCLALGTCSAIAEESAAAHPSQGWFKHIDLSGLVEFEAAYQDPFEGDSESDFVLATAELGIGAQVNDWVAAEITFLYEEDDTDLEVDVATVTIANPSSPWHIVAGQQYLPFGSFETMQVSDPLTLEIGETRETALLVGFDKDGFGAAVYAFNGDLEKDGDNRIDSFGATVGYGVEHENATFATKLGYISSLGDSDALQDVVGSEVTDHVGALFADAIYRIGDLTFIAEFVVATDTFKASELDFKGSGAKPKAWNLEAGYAFLLAGRDSTVAIAYQGTDEALALDLPGQRIMAALSVGIVDNTALSLEYAYDSDYDKSDGGTDETASTITAQLAYAF